MIERKFVIERVSAPGLCWLMPTRKYGCAWTADKRNARRFLQRKEAEEVVEGLRSSIPEPLRVVTLVELSKG